MEMRQNMVLARLHRLTKRYGIEVENGALSLTEYTEL